MKQIATWIRDCDLAHFNRVFESYPETHLCDARVETICWPQMDGLLLTGGSDISQDFLRQPDVDPGVIEDPDPSRDAWEFPAIAEALARQLPVLAICRGLQVLNVALGGTLYLDIPRHDSAKTVNVQPLRYLLGARHQFPLVNSSHHQALNQLGTGVEVEAWCADDGVIEQVRLRDYPFGVGVQYHPERDPLYQPLFDDFVNHLNTKTHFPPA